MNCFFDLIVNNRKKMIGQIWTCTMDCDANHSSFSFFIFSSFSLILSFFIYPSIHFTSVNFVCRNLFVLHIKFLCLFHSKRWQMIGEQFITWRYPHSKGRVSVNCCTIAKSLKFLCPFATINSLPRLFPENIFLEYLLTNNITYNLTIIRSSSE